MLLYQSAPADRKADPEPEKWTNAYGSFTRPAYETKQRYLEMAKEIYAWSAEHLADHNHPGKIFDSRHGENSVGHPLIYNQGTFIGASTLLYLETGDKKYLKNAINGADYSINVMSAEHGLLPWAHNPNDPYHQGSLEQGVYPAIWTEYMKLLINDCGQHQYIPFMHRMEKPRQSPQHLRRRIMETNHSRPHDRQLCGLVHPGSDANQHSPFNKQITPWGSGSR